MKKFIGSLYDECMSYELIPDVYFDESKKDGDIPCLDNFYSKAVLNKFDGTMVPTRNSELEDLALYISDCIQEWNGGDGFDDGEECQDENSQKFYDALCHCLMHIDYESARYKYDFYCQKRDLRFFYEICNQYGVEYDRVCYAFEYDSSLYNIDVRGFRKEYLDSMINDISLMNNSKMIYYGKVLLQERFQPTYRKHVTDDWLSNPKIKAIWDKIPDEYIRNHYMDYDYYAKLAKDGRLPLFAICVDVLREEVEDLGNDDLKINFSEIEKAMRRRRFISRKLIEAYDLETLKDNKLDIDQRYEWFIEKKWPELSLIVKIFPTYSATIKNSIRKAAK